MDSLYYQYYLYSVKILKDDEPYATTVFMLGLSFGFLINFLANVLLINLFCYPLSKWEMIATQLIIILILYFFYNKSGRGKKVVKQQPLFFSSPIISRIITVAFFLVTSLMMIIGQMYLKELLNKC